MKKSILIGLICLCCSFGLFAQKSVTALRIAESVKIDGNLDEAMWTQAETATGFTNFQPVAGEMPSQATEVKILYDDKAIYFGAYLAETSRDEISTELSSRDNINYTDWFGVVLDTYGNATEASEFIVLSTGTQFDARVSAANGEDPSWDAVWKSATQLTDKGWYLEIMIPYSAIRFPKKEVQEWKVNFMRRKAKTGEKSSFQYIDPEVAGFITQTAYLNGVKNIKPPIRLSLLPYVSAYALHSKDESRDPVHSTGYSYNGGLDLKYGINESFTLDMTLIPDFGQVQSDDQVLNLSPFEVRFAENRPFFTEGVEMFNKGNLFYSRRVGGRPIGMYNVPLQEAEQIEDNPQETQLYNATKLSGRTGNGLGVGFFNAIAAKTEATVVNHNTSEKRKVETAPLTNYNVLVLDQNLPNNSSVSLTNTNVWRDGDRYHDANVTALTFDLKNKKQSYQLDGLFALSQLLNPNTDNVNGITYEIEISKINGAFSYWAEMAGTSPEYNSNDLSFHTQTDVKNYNLGANYSFNKGLWKLNRLNLWANLDLATTYNENEYSHIHFNSGFWTQAKNQWEYNMWFNYRPKYRDFFEARTRGRYFEKPAFVSTGLWMGTDARKKFRINGSVNTFATSESGRYNLNMGINLRYRFSNRMSAGVGTRYFIQNNDIGFVSKNAEAIYMGQRDVLTIPNSAWASYSFNSKMSLDFNLRHYWSRVNYHEFYSLSEDGKLISSSYDNYHDQQFNQFNIDMNFRWRFAPGSDIFLVWKNNISGFDSSEQINYNELRYGDAVNGLSDLPQNNSLSVRLVYYIDYASIAG